MRKTLPAAISALIAMLLAVAATYALLRAHDVLFTSEPNPATVVWSVHIAMFWRLAIGGYVAGMIAPIAFLAARHDILATVNTLYVMTLVVGAIVFAQGLVLP